MRLDHNQRKGLAGALYGLGNIFAASLVLGQSLAPGGFKVLPFAIGLILFVSAYIVATMLNRGKEESR